MNKLLLLFLFLPFFAQAQHDTLSSLDDIHFMLGEWHGEGWFQRGPEKKYFVQEETIVPKVRGTLFMVDGVGYHKDSSRTAENIVHDAFGIISFNPERGGLTMLAYATTGGKMEVDFYRIGDKQLEWSFEGEGGGTVRFREDFRTEGIWLETGEYSPDEGKTWFQFFETRLERKE